MNSDHAPTAEEPLPPLDDSIVKSVDELSRHMRVQIAEIVAVRYMVANNVLCGLDEREKQLLAALRENREKDAKIAEAEKSNAKVPKMYVWGTGRQGFYATAQAYSVAEARELLLEETGTTDGSCPIRALAIDAIRNENPTIFYRSNAQFTLTDSAELEEMDAYAETLRNRAEAAESKLRAVSDALEEKMQHWTPQGAEWANYVKSEVDARDARIRAIIAGK